MQGSNNGVNWTDLDEQTFDITHDTNSSTLHFKYNKNVNQAFTYFRLQAHGNRGVSKSILAIHRIEFYGKLYLNSYFYTIKSKYSPNISLQMLFILFFYSS